MQYLPICVDLRQQTCLVVGGGEVAARKAALLCRAGAQVTLVAPELSPAVATMAAAGTLRTFRRPFDEADLEPARVVRLVIAATDDTATNARVARLAAARGQWVNVVDDPHRCNFVMPAIVDRDPILVAISSSGASPVLARILRGRIEAMLPSGLGRFAELLRRYRPRVKRALPTIEDRRRFWEHALDGPIADAASTGDLEDAEAQLLAALGQGTTPPAGRVAELVHIRVPSADPDDLTFHMARQMQAAGTIVHDGDVTAGVVERCRRDAALRAVDATADALPALRDVAAPGSRVCWLTRGRPADGVHTALAQLASDDILVR